MDQICDLLHSSFTAFNCSLSVYTCVLNGMITINAFGWYGTATAHGSYHISQERALIFTITIILTIIMIVLTFYMLFLFLTNCIMALGRVNSLSSVDSDEK